MLNVQLVLGSIWC